MPPTLEARYFQSMYVFGNHINISIYLLLTTRTLGKSPWNNTKLNRYQMPNQLGPSKGNKIKVIISPPFSKIPMIIAKVVMYVKLMHKGLM
jgi:hypothetical protein